MRCGRICASRGNRKFSLAPDSRGLFEWHCHQHHRGPTWQTHRDQFAFGRRVSHIGKSIYATLSRRRPTTMLLGLALVAGLIFIKAFCASRAWSISGCGCSYRTRLSTRISTIAAFKLLAPFRQGCPSPAFLQSQCQILDHWCWAHARSFSSAFAA